MRERSRQIQTSYSDNTHCDNTQQGDRANISLGRRDFLRLLGRGLVVASGASLVGCGGGGGTARGGSGGGSQPGSGQPGTAITPAQRAAAIQAVNTQMNTFAQQNGRITDQQVIAYLKTRPEFSSVGSIESGGAWAKFTDGETFAINYSFVEPDPAKSNVASYTPQQANTRAAGSELPQNDQARIMNALGAAFTPPHDDLNLWCIHHGYTRDTKDATIEGLKNVDGDGLFYINSHGLHCKTPDGATLWAMWTADEVSPEKDAQYHDLLADGSIVRYSAIHDRALIQNPFNDTIEGTFSTHYAITKRFVEKFNWHFGKNSFVFFNCCWSADAEFAQACIDRGASAYAGWTNAANPPEAWRAARYVYDRLLGDLKNSNNEYPDADGPQRAYTLGQVVTGLKQRGWQNTTTTYGTGELIFGPNNGEFGLLAPTIQYLETDEFNKKLILNGQFGTDPGAGIRYVRMNGTDLNVTKWTPTRIECDILPTQSGDVWVQIVARKSNIRQLTMWDGTVDLTETGPETLKATANLKYRFRADVGKFRLSPDTALQDRVAAFYAVMDPAYTTGTLAYSGQADLAGTTPEHTAFTAWRGQGTLRNAGPGNGDSFIVVHGSIDTKTHEMQLSVIMLATDILQAQSYVKFRGAILGGFSDEWRPGPTTFPSEFGDVTSGQEKFFVMTLDDQFNLAAGQRTANVKPPTEIDRGFLDEQVATIPAVLKFSAMSAQTPPRTDESRAARR